MNAMQHDALRLAESIVNSLTMPTFVIDAGHRIIAWNKACEHLTGIAADAIIGTTDVWRSFYEQPRPCLANLVLDDELEKSSDLYSTAGPSKFTQGAHAEGWFNNLNGKRRYLIFDANPIYDEHGALVAVLENLADVTEIKLAEEKLKLTAQVFSNTAEAILITDAQNRIMMTNPAFTTLTGYTEAEVRGKNPNILSSGEHDLFFYEEMRTSLAERGFWQGELWDKRKNGEVYPKWASLSTIRDDDGDVTHHIAIFSDISERKKAQEHIEFLAHHDVLTMLPNRFLMLDHAQLAIAQAERDGIKTGLMFLDLDHFKQINDTLGHQTGDRLLQEIAGRLKECVRDTDTISRLGGDEFLVLLPGVKDPNDIATVAQKILEALQLPFDIDLHRLSTSFSIGIAVYPDDGRDFEKLLQHADTAMYHAKEHGRNNYQFFNQSMTQYAMERLDLQNRLRQAIDQDQFRLHYQPQLELHSGNIIGCEALLRWETPEGFISPAKFIPVAEESGLIMEIDAWVVEEAARQAKAWQVAGAPLVVAVNISAMQFKRGDILHLVTSALHRHELDPALLEIELTESVLIQDTKHIRDALLKLKTLGVKLSIDDYGTGYSNLSYLRMLDVDKLKIDQSFIKNMMENDNDAVIVRSTVDLSHNLGLKVIAEGVETQATLDLLHRLECDESQGYHLGRPMPPDELENFLRTR